MTPVCCSHLHLELGHAGREDQRDQRGANCSGNETEASRKAEGHGGASEVGGGIKECKLEENCDLQETVVVAVEEVRKHRSTNDGESDCK